MPSICRNKSKRLFLRIDDYVMIIWHTWSGTRRFSPDQETSLGLVQREGGPCGVLAPIQVISVRKTKFGQVLAK